MLTQAIGMKARDQKKTSEKQRREVTHDYSRCCLPYLQQRARLNRRSNRPSEYWRGLIDADPFFSPTIFIFFNIVVPDGDSFRVMMATAAAKELNGTAFYSL
jgi:hypothetical protein